MDVSKLKVHKHVTGWTWKHGGVTGKKLENHVQEYTGWILFKTHNFYIFLDIQQRPLNVNLGIIYNVWCGLSRGIYYCQIYTP